MKETLHQGDIVKIERVKSPVLVTSKDFFNQTGEIIGCPDSEKIGISIFFVYKYCIIRQISIYGDRK